MSDELGKKEVILLDEWAICLEDGTYCRIEEQELRDIHFKGIVHVEAKPKGCLFCPYKNSKDISIVTGSIRDVGETGVFVTLKGTHYLLGKPHPLYAKLFGFGEVGLVNRVTEIVMKKKLL